MVAELLRGASDYVIASGQPAPDFALDGTRGEHVHLVDLRGRPVLLHFVSYTCPVTRGGVVPMRELHRRYGDRVQFLDMIVRQAHSGERHEGYEAYSDKLEDAREYADEEGITWPVLVDDLDATVQRAYAGWQPHFHRLSAFLHDATWEPTNNAAERGGRSFRHGQHPHFRLHLVRSIEADLKVCAYLKKERFCSPQPVTAEPAPD